MPIKQKCQKCILEVTIKWTNEFWKNIFCRNKVISVERLSFKYRKAIKKLAKLFMNIITK